MNKVMTGLASFSLLAIFINAPAFAEESESTLRMARATPMEWSFSDCMVGLSTKIEQSLEKTMESPRHEERAEAAALLWRNHSLVHAPEVLAFAAETAMTEEFGDRQSLRKQIEASFQLEALRYELKEGDTLWALRLVWLRPNPDLADDLLNLLKTRPHEGYGWNALVLAVGKTRDRRALEPLLEMLKQEGSSGAGFAAEALGDLGFPEAEPDLIAALARESSFVQRRATWSLGEIGTEAALPALRKIADSKEQIGVIDTKSAAAKAIEKIRNRAGSKK